MKLIITCVHLVRHFDYYESKLKNAGIDPVVFNPINQQFNAEQMLEILPGSNYIIAGDDEIDSKVINESAKNGLKAIIKWGIGVDNIDLVAAKENNVSVYNTPDVFGPEVAEQAISFLLNLTRGTHIINSKVREGIWHKIEGTSLKDKNVGIIGFGSIGKAIAERLIVFGLKINIFDPFLKKDIDSFSNVSFKEICESSDFIILACSLNKDNENMINKSSISKMLKTPYIINVSRGPLINEKDLVNAMIEGKIKGAALDVFEEEPLSLTSDLITKTNFILGSHNSSNTFEAVKKVNDMTIEMVVNFLNTDFPQIYKKCRLV